MTSRNALGANLGAGVLATATGSVGVHGDVRYFRDIVGNSRGDGTSIDVGSFHFRRASVTLLVRF